MAVVAGVNLLGAAALVVEAAVFATVVLVDPFGAIGLVVEPLVVDFKDDDAAAVAD